MVDFRNMKRMSLAEIRREVNNMTTVHSRPVYVSLQEFVPEELALNSRIRLRKNRQDELGGEDHTGEIFAFSEQASHEKEVIKGPDLVLPSDGTKPENEELDLSEMDKRLRMEEDIVRKLDRLQKLVGDLDDTPEGVYCREATSLAGDILQMYVENKSEPKQVTGLMGEMAGYQALYSTKPQKYIVVKTRDYTPVDHKEAFAPFLDAMEKMEIQEIQARIEETDIYANVVMVMRGSEFTIVPDDGVPINFGFRLRNGFDALSAWYGGWAIRGGGGLGCENVFSVNSVFSFVRVPHVGRKERIIEKLQNYVDTMSYKGEELLKKINGCMDVKVEDSMVMWVLNACGFGPKSGMRVKAVYDTYAEDEKGNMWSVINACTQVARDWDIQRQDNYFNRMGLDDLFDDPKGVLEVAYENRRLAQIEVLNQAAAGSAQVDYRKIGL